MLVAAVAGSLFVVASLLLWPRPSVDSNLLDGATEATSQSESQPGRIGLNESGVAGSDPADAEDCEPDMDSEPLEYPAGLTALEFELAVEVLMASPDPHHKFAGALLTGGEERWQLRIKRFGVALEANRRDPVMLSLAFSECDRQHLEGWCEENNIEESLIEADPNNGESWAIIANRRLTNGDKEGGLIAMEQAAGSPDANAYFAELFGVVERGLAAAGVGDISNRFMIAMGFAAAQIRSYGMIAKVCEEESATDYRWRTACMTYGRKLEQEARTDIDTIMGTAMQRAVLRAEGDDQGLHEIDSRRDQLRARMMQRVERGFEKTLIADENMLSQYMNEFMTKSEFDAQVYLVDEQRKWLESRCAPTDVGPDISTKKDSE